MFKDLEFSGCGWEAKEKEELGRENESMGGGERLAARLHRTKHFEDQIRATKS